MIEMIRKGEGTSPLGEMPQGKAGLAATLTKDNCSALKAVCKPPEQTIFNRFDRKGIEAHLQLYLGLGLTPILLKGKKPIVKWLYGDWNPKMLDDLRPYLNRSNWGLRTGGNFAVLDFDTKQDFYDFVAENIERLPSDAPIVKTGRGYHVWFRPARPLKSMRFEGVDIKAEGGLVVAPPSIHPDTNRRYKFIRPPKEDIPELDLNELVFPNLKKRDTDNGKPHRSTRSTGGIRTDKPRFNYDDIKDGVDEGQRHTALVSYTGHMIWRDLSEEQIMVLAADWNEKNRPPLTDDELVSTVDYCCSRYAKEKAPDKNAVPTKTLNNLNSVIVETKEYPRLGHRQSLYIPESPNPTPAPDLAASWETEDAREYTHQDCGKKRAIMRKGREYMSVSFFCGRWDCPRCGPYFRQRWISHMVEKTKDTDLHVIEIPEADWGRVRRSINRLDADYMRIKVGNVLRIITDKPIENSIELARDDISTYLESSIPTNASKCPISTSRNWEHHKKEKTSNEYEAVTITWLPVKDQTEVAEGLGARVVKHARWVSPEDADEEEWAEEFKQGIRKRERLVTWWLKHPTYGLDMRDYLNQQYAEDAVNDEYGNESFIDRYLFEAA